jgi:hypothetical protein
MVGRSVAGIAAWRKKKKKYKQYILVTYLTANDLKNKDLMYSYYYKAISHSV